MKPLHSFKMNSSHGRRKLRLLKGIFIAPAKARTVDDKCFFGASTLWGKRVKRSAAY